LRSNCHAENQTRTPSIRQIERTISEHNARFFEVETEKLEGWADDLKFGLEREIKEIDRQIKEARRAATAALTLEEKKWQVRNRSKRWNSSATPSDVHSLIRRARLTGGGFRYYRLAPSLLDKDKWGHWVISDKFNLQQLSDEVGSDRSLLVVCSAFRGRKDGYGNLTVKKIPKAVLSRCEWGKDDYSLKVENLPKAPPPKGQMDLLALETD
jgi:hypothetical protein